ncbi:hypothetical protein AB0756_24970 [Tolypothrix campylonemoides VB511288_2]|uniref:Uncharacterized protein n=2 Tax=Nostocales TaxID=1161 RepID=A0ABW8WVS3_9CYAN
MDINSYYQAFSNPFKDVIPKAPAELGEWLRSGRISEDKPLMQTLLV